MEQPVPNSMSNYIYLDSKIIGTAYQIVQYFNSQVFDRYNTVIYFKTYKESYKQFVHIFKKNYIQFNAFEKFSDINMASNAVVFYLFNAQSNCRLVANRNLKHIFVTHGESNKAASIKPIIRIYDYVVTAGQMGINRYLSHKIFNSMDVAEGRIIMMGNTFVGRSAYVHNKNADALLYAPTWEGGVPEENYSSLEWPNIFQKLLDYLRQKNVNTLVIQPHPNLGHRLDYYKVKLYAGTKFLLQSGIQIVMVKDSIEAQDYYYKLKFKSFFKFENKNSSIEIQEAFSDISAMEAQLYADFIPVRTFIKDEQYNFKDEFLNHYYQQTAILTDHHIMDYHNPLKNDFYNYIFGYSFPLVFNMSLHERIEWLVHHIYSDSKIV